MIITISKILIRESPKGGYTRIVKKLLEGVQVCLNTDFFANREELTAQADKVLFTGMIDEFYDYLRRTGIQITEI